jgi:hypothetical protein
MVIAATMTGMVITAAMTGMANTKAMVLGLRIGNPIIGTLALSTSHRPYTMNRDNRPVSLCSFRSTFFVKGGHGCAHRHPWRARTRAAWRRCTAPRRAGQSTIPVVGKTECHYVRQRTDGGVQSLYFRTEEQPSVQWLPVAAQPIKRVPYVHNIY